MTLAKAKTELEGTIDIGINNLVVVCAHCGNSDKSNARIELNFQERRFICLCSKCKKENSVEFGKDRAQPLPRTRLGQS